jgi:hypothetical protein
VRYRFAGSKRSEFEDLSEALQLAHQAAGMYTGQHPLRLAALNNLIGPLLLPFEIHQSPAYLEEVIEIATKVLEGRNQSNTHSDRLSSLHNLATLLLKSTGFHCEDDIMQRAISMQTDVVDSAPSSHPLRSEFYEHLETVLWARYERSKERSDILKATQLIERALELEPSPHSINHSTSSRNGTLGRTGSWTRVWLILRLRLWGMVIGAQPSFQCLFLQFANVDQLELAMYQH